MTVPRAQLSTHRGRVFFEVIRWQITSFSQFQIIACSSFFFQWFIWNMLCLCHYGPALLRFWFQTDLGRENWSRVGHALRPIFMLWLVKIWQWVHAENLCSILKVVYFDSQSWQSFVSTCDVFNCLFPLDVQNEIQLLSRVFCYSWLVCLPGFGWEMRRLSKPIIRFRMASFLFFTLLDAYENYKSSSDPYLTW